MLLVKLYTKQLKSAGRILGSTTSRITANLPAPRSCAERSCAGCSCASVAEHIFADVGSCLNSMLARTIIAVPVSLNGAWLNASI